jgi:hypothetical protein
MPHKLNADRRDKIPKQKHRVTNWAEYNEGLRRRGDLTVWISDEALGMWSAARRTTRGGQPRYSDLAIELCLTLGMVFKQPLRQTQGFMRSIAGILGVEIGIVAGTPAGLLDTLLADDLDIHDAAQIQRFSPPQV